MRLRLSALAERLRSSLFFVPMLAVVAALGAGFVSLYVDQRLERRGVELPLGLTATVDSSRALLGTVAGATISFAGVAFSVSLLIIQLASSQYSPRVVHTLFRDPYSKRVMALVVGTFTYCVVVLRTVRSELEDGGNTVVPNLSVAIALVLGIATILAIVAFINHSAHSMDISEILERVRAEAVRQIDDEWALAGTNRSSITDLPDDVSAINEAGDPDAPGLLVRFDRSGWVQEIEADKLLESLPDGSVVHIETLAGRYAVAGTLLCKICPAPPEHSRKSVTELASAAVAIGHSRTMQQDVTYGLRQLADVALKALSPAVNDPTTAQDAIFHSAAVLFELLRRDPPARVGGAGGRRLVMRQQPRPEELIRLAFDETRRAAANQPAVCIYLLEAFELVAEALMAEGLDERTSEFNALARLTLAGAEASGMLAEDVELVRSAYAKRFAG